MWQESEAVSLIMKKGCGHHLETVVGRCGQPKILEGKDHGQV